MSKDVSIDEMIVYVHDVLIYKLKSKKIPQDYKRMDEEVTSRTMPLTGYTGSTGISGYSGFTGIKGVYGYRG
jgi:hypothetical protein